MLTDVARGKKLGKEERIKEKQEIIKQTSHVPASGEFTYVRGVLACNEVILAQSVFTMSA